jgi:cobyrinic acid a,c-diamide synthase
VEPGKGEAVYRQGSVHASYFHAWFPSHPRAVAALLGAEPVCWDGPAELS